MQTRAGAMSGRRRGAWSPDAVNVVPCMPRLPSPWPALGGLRTGLLMGPCAGPSVPAKQKGCQRDVPVWILDYGED